MPILLSPSFVDPLHIFLGDTALKAVYKGENLVWRDTGGGIEMIFDKIPVGFDYSAIITNSGLLYSFAVAEDARNIAPPGWHVAGYYEWLDIRSYIGINNSHKLKTTDDGFWETEFDDGENLHSFNVLPNGQRQSNDIINGFGSYATWWTRDHDFWSPTLYSGMYIDLTTVYGYAKQIIGGSYAPGRTAMGLRMVKDDANNTGSMTDNDGNVYNTVSINGVVWTTSNHKGIKFRNGDSVPYVSISDSWNQSDNVPQYCYPRKRIARDLTVSEWNQIFSFSSYTSLFTSVVIDSQNNKIILNGGRDLEFSNYNGYSPLFRKYDTNMIRFADLSYVGIISIPSNFRQKIWATNLIFSSIPSMDLQMFNYSKLITLGFPEMTDSANLYVSGQGLDLEVQLLYLNKLTNIPAIFGNNGINGTKLRYINMSSALTFSKYYTTYSCFYPVQNNVLTIVINPILMTSNNGGIDVDIQYLIDHNTLTILDPSLNQLYP